MKPAAWRLLTLAICAVASLSAFLSFTTFVGVGGAPPWTGREGLVWSSAGPFQFKVTDVDPGGPGARAGFRIGDVIDLRANTLQERLWITNRPLTGRQIPLLVHRGTLEDKLVLVPDPYIQLGRWYVDANFLTSPFETILFAFIAALIAWRRSHVPELRLLSLNVAVIACWNEFSGICEWATPWAWTYVVAGFLNATASPLAVALSVAYAGCFARPLTLPRRAFQWLAYAAAAIWSIQYMAANVGIITMWFDPSSPAIGSLIPAYALAIGALACCVLAFTASRGAERRRVAWTLLPVAVILYDGTLAFAIPPFLIANSYVGGDIANSIQAAIQVLAACALAYAVLSRRVIDVGFVLNRAVVFTLVSTIVIAVFVLVEWAASAWLTNVTHTTSAVIGMAVALGLGFSLRYIHKFVDRFVDNSIFRKRHENESALRRFAREASYITDRAILLDRSVRIVNEHTDADNAAILIRGESASYASATAGEQYLVNENDPGIVALRAWHKPVDLHTLRDSQIHGEFAMPMVSRGELVGALICGPKRDGETYAPDELDALQVLAQGVGSALDVMNAGRGNPIHAIAKELAELRAATERDRALLMRELREHAQRERELLLRELRTGARQGGSD